MIQKHHYQKTLAPINVRFYGLFRDGHHIGVITFGYGTRPLHTIRNLFPSLRAPDYLEIGRMCVLDSEPRNTETQFLRMAESMLRRDEPARKVIFTWADGIRGKPGFVYQAANYLYGGAIQSEVYVDKDGNVLHPRLLITRYGRRDKAFTDGMGIHKIRGQQFRYIRFLCSHKERKRLLRESTVQWSQDYPKMDSLHWTVADEAGEVSREIREPPRFEGQVRFLHPASQRKITEL